MHKIGGFLFTIFIFLFVNQLFGSISDSTGRFGSDSLNRSSALPELRPTFGALTMYRAAGTLRDHKHDFEFSSKRPSYTGFYFGLNLGALFPNRYQANFYNGASGNVDSIGLIFNNYYYKEDIRRELNDTFRLLELPLDMKYKATYQIGFYIRYNFVRNSGIFIQFNYAKLEAKDFFTMGIGGTPQYLTFDNIQLFPIWGKEERIYIDIGASQTFPLDKILGLYMEAGLNINNTRVLEHKIAIGNLQYSLINIYGNSPYVPNTQMQTYETRLGGLGIGAFLSAGMRAIFDKNISIDLGGTFHWNNANIEGYERYRPHFGAYVRLCFRKLYNENADSNTVDD